MALTKVTSGVRTIAASEITTAAIADDAVTLAKLAHGTDGNLITYDASGAPAAVATGTAGHVLTSAGVGAPPVFAAIGPIEGSQLTPTTASVDFTAPTTGITGVTVMFNEISANGATATDVVMVQIGDSGGIETTGYTGWVARIGSTASAYSLFATGFEISQSQTNTTSLVGHVTLAHVGSNSWTEAGNISSSASTHNMQLSAGAKPLTGELTTVRITTLNGTILFDAGTCNVIWHF
jgi:hypothetical protein